MKEIFLRWFKATHPNSKAEWAYKVHLAFQDYYRKEFRLSLNKCNVRLWEVKKWLSHMGIIIIDTKGDKKHVALSLPKLPKKPKKLTVKDLDHFDIEPIEP